MNSISWPSPFNEKSVAPGGEQENYEGPGEGGAAYAVPKNKANKAELSINKYGQFFPKSMVSCWQEISWIEYRVSPYFSVVLFGSKITPFLSLILFTSVSRAELACPQLTEEGGEAM